MNAPVRGFGSFVARLVDREQPAAAKLGAAAELRALDVGLDSASADPSEVGPPIFGGATSAIDRLRLPLPPNAGRDVGAATARILAADISLASTAKELVAKEAKMRRVLEALDGVVDHVQVRTAQAKRR